MWLAFLVLALTCDIPGLGIAEVSAETFNLLQRCTIVGAILATASPFFDTRLDRIVGFAADKRLPAIYQFRE